MKRYALIALLIALAVFQNDRITVLQAEIQTRQDGCTPGDVAASTWRKVKSWASE